MAFTMSSGTRGQIFGQENDVHDILGRWALLRQIMRGWHRPDIRSTLTIYSDRPVNTNSKIPRFQITILLLFIDDSKWRLRCPRPPHERSSERRKDSVKKYHWNFQDHREIAIRDRPVNTSSKTHVSRRKRHLIYLLQLATWIQSSFEATLNGPQEESMSHRCHTNHRHTKLKFSTKWAFKLRRFLWFYSI